MTTVSTEYASYYNPFQDLVDGSNEYSETIQLLDEFSEASGYGGDLLPSHLLTVLSLVEVEQIRNNAARVHHRSQQVYETLKDGNFTTLLSDNWKGGDADEFEDYIVGGGGHRGLDLYFEEVKAKTELLSLSFIGLADTLEGKITEAHESVVDNLRKLKEKIDEGADLVGGTSEMHTIISTVLGGGGLGILLAIPGINIIVAVICVILIIIVLVDQLLLANTAQVAEDVVDAIESAISDGASLESGNVDSLGASSW